MPLGLNMRMSRCLRAAVLPGRKARQAHDEREDGGGNAHVTKKLSASQ